MRSSGCRGRRTIRAVQFTLWRIASTCKTPPTVGRFPLKAILFTTILVQHLGGLLNSQALQTCQTPLSSLAHISHTTMTMIMTSAVQIHTAGSRIASTPSHQTVGQALSALQPVHLLHLVIVQMMEVAIETQILGSQSVFDGGAILVVGDEDGGRTGVDHALAQSHVGHWTFRHLDHEGSYGGLAAGYRGEGREVAQQYVDGSGFDPQLLGVVEHVG